VTPEVALRTSQPLTVSSLLNPVVMWSDLWRHRDLSRQFAVRYFLTRFRGTYLGVLWALIFPLLMLLVYTFIFTYIFSARSGNETRPQYAVWLFCGMAVFGLFSASVMRACGVVLENPQYVTKVVFPLQILPVANLGASLMYTAIELVLVTVGVAIFHSTLNASALLTPVVLLPLLAMSLGVSWFLASLTVFVRDVSNVAVIVVSQFLFFLTPIFWKKEELLGKMPQLSWLIDFNPLAVIVENARRCILWGQMPDWRGWAIGMAIGLITMQLGYAWFMKSKRGFADVL